MFCMNVKNEIRKITLSRLSESQIDSLYKIYYCFRYGDEMQKKAKYGEKNADKTFYVIRPRKDCVEGLLSLFWNVVRNVDYAEENNYIPVVDFKNYKTQYTINDTDNVWGYYFSQPSDYTLEDVYNSKNVILSGLETQWYKREKYKACYEQKKLDDFHRHIFGCIDFSDEVKKRLLVEKNNLGIDLKNTIGLYLRGTDYIRLKPSGHPVQPTVNQAIDIVDEYMEKYETTNIFLVTEDGEIYDAIKTKYGDKCITPSFDKYIYGYKGNKFISKDNCINDLAADAYERGMQYLIKMIILSECGYLVGGNTNGMWAVNVFAKKHFKDRFIFDLGMYGK